jgi:hypothetical protein
MIAPATLAATARHYPQKFDIAADAVGFVPLDRAGYRAASFLDDRIGAGEPRWIGAGAVAEALQAGATPLPLHAIFHTGHVGSTLLSRLLDEHKGVLGLREPLPLRTLADFYDRGYGAFDTRLDLFLKLWSRGFDGTEAVVVKASSSAGRIAPQILAARPAARAVYLNLAAEPYLATLLAGANSVLDLRGFEPERRRRLRGRYGIALPVAVSTGELAAIAWLAESLSRADALATAPERVLALDFDTLLADVPATLGRVFAHFDMAVSKNFLAGLAASPALTRYSKAPDAHAYSPALRSELLAQARREQAGEIAKGLKLIERLAAADARVATLL